MPKDAPVADEPIPGVVILGGTAGSRITPGPVFDNSFCFNPLRLEAFVLPYALRHMLYAFLFFAMRHASLF